MGLLDKLQQQGSILTAYNGNTPSINPLATQLSKLHDSYSTTGDNASQVNADFQAYLDGTINILPQPTNLDLSTAPTEYIKNMPR
jgi:hypothetical protein